MARHVAFFRNVNLGHPGSPVRTQIEAAFAAAGALEVRSFQSNGTVAFASDAPVRAMKRVATELRAACGYDGDWFVRRLADLPALAEAEAWSGAGTDVFGETLTFFGVDPAPLPDMPWTNEAGDVSLLAVSKGCVLGVSRERRASPGDPNSTIERLLGAPATTRSRGTVQRLLRAVTPPSA